jgi:hypothetical protein
MRAGRMCRAHAPLGAAEGIPVFSRCKVTASRFPAPRVPTLTIYIRVRHEHCSPVTSKCAVLRQYRVVITRPATRVLPPAALGQGSLTHETAQSLAAFKIQRHCLSRLPCPHALRVKPRSLCD